MSNACKFGGPNQACVPGNCNCWASGPDEAELAKWPESNRQAYLDVPLKSVAIERLIEEVRVEKYNPPTDYNRWHNRHNR